ncbi:protein of unknown function [Methanocaldococcus lauensis]|uniref:Uncharacterized protein n=1 Tax=Methanocaldococcus lauensis TaxID=2546128 RepID=A0A8D6PWQ6_9EURY|nr:protein of unknown function [Methanocaldococcus lauensis]
MGCETPTIYPEIKDNIVIINIRKHILIFLSIISHISIYISNFSNIMCMF